MAIYHDVDQYSDAWNKLRLGLPSSSQFKKIITEKKGELSKSRTDYMYHLLAEKALGRPIDTFTTPAMERGSELEPEAVGYYEFMEGVEAKRIGFVTDDNRRYGCSPDRLIGEDGLLEIKCPSPNTHMRYLLEGSHEADYRQQVQGQLLVTGRKWVDLISYHPEFPENLKLAIVRIEADWEYQGLLSNALDEFLSEMASATIKLGQKLAIGQSTPEALDLARYLEA